MKALAPNTLLQNRYLIVQLIGKGGMGEVYLGVDQRLGSAVAIKRTFFSDDETLTLAFEREAKTLARLRHPSLPKVSDHFTEDGVQYLVMEHISGDDLSKRLELTNQPFPLNWVLFWADQLLDGLAYLHSHEPPIIHRDIKPQNLKLTSDNHIILLDFGLAKNSIGETRLSTSGSVVGYTPHYASMEQIRGTGTTPKSDIYSLCATLYQLLTNTVPPDALSRADNILNSFPDPIKPLYDFNPEVSHPISDVILKGMSLSAEQRYPGAREMQRALRDAYAQIQTAMTAQTEAFNVADIPQVKTPTPAAVVPASQMQTEDLSAQIANQIPQSVSGGYQSAPVNTNDYKIAPPAENFDATIPYDMPMTGEKTEIIPNGLQPLASANNFSDKTEAFNIPPNNIPPKKEETFDSYEDFGKSEDVSNQATAVNFISLPTNEQKTEQSEPTPHFDREAVAPPPVPLVSEAPKKKSNGKIFAVVGGIAGLAILAVVAAVVVLFLLKPSTTTTTVTPSPTPTATLEPSVTPTVEATPEPTLQADSNTSTNSNTETDLTTSNTDANSSDPANTSSDSSTVAVQNPTRPADKTTTPGKTTQQPPRNQAQNKPTTQQPPKTQPQTKPTTASRTTLLQ